MPPRALFLLATCAASLAAATPAGAGEASAARGQDLARRHCARCHAVEPTGDSREPAAPPFRELNRRYAPEALSEALAEGLLTGHPLMPEFRFGPDDAQSVILYLKSIQSRQPS
ncbi:cytochrome c [Phenylobacterium sp.]|uniref:c-type cytochrome n=1 Tax=Phenylobacterium sp. TaxID=1871053 RepID=UPI0025F8B33D|nr:cytochrome c [Phenylobacterium sp.]